MSDEIERVPSLRKPSRQGVPKRKTRDMAKPMLESGKTKDAPPITPRGMPGAATPHVERQLPDEPDLPIDPTLALEMELGQAPVLEGLAPPVPEAAFEPDPEPEPEPEPEPVVEREPEPEPVVEPQPGREPEPVAAHQPEPAANPRNWVASAESVASPPEPELEPERQPEPPPAPRLTLRQLLARTDDAFEQFRAAAYRYPKEHMDEHLGEDQWTRKQMLAHIAVWHDNAADRLIKMFQTGRPVPLDRSVDSVNAAAARVAIGKTAGEVLKDTESTYARLRRQILRMTDDQLHADDEWALQIIAGDTYEHYGEHIAELTPPEPLPGTAARR
jgi:hypothetical protein